MAKTLPPYQPVFRRTVRPFAPWRPVFMGAADDIARRRRGVFTVRGPAVDSRIGLGGKVLRRRK